MGGRNGADDRIESYHIAVGEAIEIRIDLYYRGRDDSI